MKNIVCIISLMLGIIASYAQQTPDEPLVPKDEKAKQILDKLSAKTKSYAAIQANFSYNLFNKTENIDETQDGIIEVKGDKYRLKIAGQEIISDGSIVWTVIQDAEEVQINQVSNDEKDETINPSKIFTLYEKGFKYKYQGEETQEGTTVQLIKLFPIDANKKSYHTIILSIDKNMIQIKSVVILSKDGNKYTYKLKNLDGTVNFDDNHFTFNSKTHPDYEIVDLREDN